jgi:pimeloyl-ACP methyl ester carboxylesterase
VALLDHLAIARTDLVGWSDGADIGLQLAIESPDRLNRAVIYGANSSPDGAREPTPSDQLPPFDDVIASYQRLSPAAERFDEFMAALDALHAARSRAGLQRGAVARHHRAGADPRWRQGGDRHPRTSPCAWRI